MEGPGCLVPIYTWHGDSPRNCALSEMYLKMVNGVMMRPSEKLLVFRSQPLNLKYDHERPLAVKAIMALLKWLKSGQSQQALFKSGPGWQISKAICCSFYMKHREKMRNL